MKTHIRIVAGELRGRKLEVQVNPNLRPTPQRVREALFSILGNAVPDRPFYDVFAGTGVIGLEALSRGASSATFLERDFRLVDDIERLLRKWDVAAKGTVVRADVYRWADRFRPPAEPVNVFVSPPFADFERRPDEFLAAVGAIMQKVHPGSVVIIQSEQGAPLDSLPGAGWDRRRYGRNELLLWVKEETPAPEQNGTAPPG